MSDYPHLKLPFRVAGLVKPQGFKNKPNPNTIKFKNQRQSHGEYLMNSASSIFNHWVNLKKECESDGFKLPNENDIPIFLRVDTDAFNIDSLTNWGIEVISEEDNGYIIGASLDELKSFREKVESFIKEEGRYKNTASKIWELVIDDSWRLKELVKGELGRMWGEIEEDVVYTIQLGVSCFINNKCQFPIRENFDNISEFELKLNEFKRGTQDIQLLRDEKQIKRETEVEEYVKEYSGIIHEIWDNEIDAIYFKVSICGKGLKDIVLTYQYLFEIELKPDYSWENNSLDTFDNHEIRVLSPPPDAAKVCVIDSGIQENHRLLEVAIDKLNSKSYVDADSSTADYVRQSGHGTKVAGAILYPGNIPAEGIVQLETIIQNARILDKDNSIATEKFEPNLMRQIVDDFSTTKIFNLSVAEKNSIQGNHMPVLAAAIDKLIHERDILFIISSGNIRIFPDSTSEISIYEHLSAGTDYPQYLLEPNSKIANPAVSSFAITVGSIAKFNFEDDDYKSLAGKERISPFSRAGLGMWGCVKPDVVEFGGDLLINKTSLQLTTRESLMPELVNCTLYGAKTVGRDCGTSFSAPKVAYIASKLMTEHPKESAQMYRALIIQSARLPEFCFDNPTSEDFRLYGYGIPNIERAVSNSESRITFIQEGRIEPKKADIYRIIIPENIRGEGKEFRILIETTLAFTSQIRSTRRGAHSYLANWLEWRSSKYNESFISFRDRTIKYLESDEQSDVEEVTNSIKWILRENPAWTKHDINRNNSTVQKSWAIIEPHQFAEEFSIAVVGHCGWDKNLENITPYSLCVSFEVLDAQVNLYEILAEAQVEIEAEQEIDI